MRSARVRRSVSRGAGGAPPAPWAVLAAAVAFVAVLAACAAPRPTVTEQPPAGSQTAPGTSADEPGPMAGPGPTSGPEPTSEQAPGTEPEPAPAPGITIMSGGSAYGTMLFDGSRQAIYIWELETTPEARCYADCAEAWPPVLTDGVPVAAGDVSAALLGTTTRSDGTTQVTYNGHPLYYYAHEAPGEVRCHDVPTHGGLWWVVQPDGNRAA